MPRRPDLDRPTQLELSISETLRVRLDLHLFSDLEGKVPRGAYKAFFEQLLREFFERRSIDLGEGLIVSGSPAAIARIEQLMKEPA